MSANLAILFFSGMAIAVMAVGGWSRSKWIVARGVIVCGITSYLIGDIYGAWRAGLHVVLSGVITWISVLLLIKYNSNY